MASIYANLLEQTNVFTREKSSTPTGLVWNTNIAAVSLFWNINMAALTSFENAHYSVDTALVREGKLEKKISVYFVLVVFTII